MSIDGSISRRDAIKIGVGAGAALTVGGTSAFAAASSWQSGALIERDHEHCA